MEQKNHLGEPSQPTKLWDTINRSLKPQNCGVVCYTAVDNPVTPDLEWGGLYLLESETNSKFCSSLGIPKWTEIRLSASQAIPKRNSLAGCGRINKNNAVKWDRVCYVSSASGPVCKNYHAIKVSNPITTICTEWNNQLAVWWEEYIKSVAVKNTVESIKFMKMELVVCECGQQMRNTIRT